MVTSGTEDRSSSDDRKLSELKDKDRALKAKPQTDRNSKRRRGNITADIKIKREVQSQLDNYFKLTTRKLDFDTRGEKKTEVFYHQKGQYPTCFRHGKCWKEKISKSIDETVSQLDLDEIWAIHDHQRAGKLMQNYNNVVQNYSRRPGNILHASRYRQWYLAKSRPNTVA